MTTRPASAPTESQIKSFTLDVPQADLDDLGDRIARTRWPAPLPGDDWDLGVPVAYLRGLAGYWRDGYDWRRHEERLNAVPQFTTQIRGQRVHFLHVRSPHDAALPLLLTHGWPGSVVEFLDIIEPLTNPPDPADAFDVVIPSLPGFGLSGPVTQGWDTSAIAQAWLELMTRLGYPRFGVQGGDIGAAVSPEVGRLAPERVIGVHVNGAAAFVMPDRVDEQTRGELTDLENDRLARIGQFMQQEYGYIAIQSTRPQTLAYGLVDSPVGQLAWLIDKFREWTYPRNELPETAIDRDRLLTNAMLYWLTGTAGSSAYVGYHSDAPSWGAAKAASGVPTASLQTAHDVGIRRFDEAENTITRWTDLNTGGHFAALEIPEVLVNDLRTFFHELRK